MKKTFTGVKCESFGQSHMDELMDGRQSASIPTPVGWPAELIEDAAREGSSVPWTPVQTIRHMGTWTPGKLGMSISQASGATANSSAFHSLLPVAPALAASTLANMPPWPVWQIGWAVAGVADGWVEVADDNVESDTCGSIYFWNQVTNETAWERPTQSHRRHPPASIPPPAGAAPYGSDVPLRSRGELDAAMEHFNRIFEVKVRVLGSGHPEVAHLQLQMAEIARSQGKLEQALEFYTRAWPSFEEHLGEAHPEAGALMSSIGIVQTQLLRLTEAATSLEKARAMQAAAHGSGHNEVAKTLANLGNVRLLQKRFDDAEQLFREALRIKEQCLGPSHAETGAELARLATCCVLQRRGKEAVELYDRALRIQESALGAEHVEVASTLGNLGRCLGRLGRLPEAEEACRRAAAIQARILGQNHPETKQSLAHLDNLANLGYPLQGKELAGSSGVVASGVVPALALDGASVPSTAPPTESDSMAGRIAAKRRARRKQFAPSRPLGAPTVSMLDALEKQQEEDKAARKEAIKDFWRANVRG